MYTKKRGQITVYIIIGMVILFLAILFFYLRGTAEKAEGMQELIKSQKIPDEIKPIITYVTASLDTAAREGLYLVGMQGGCIYEIQGGLTFDNTRYILYNDGNDEHNVSYGINKQETEYLSFYQPYPPEYPWDSSSPATKFPYIAGALNINHGKFGVYNLPPLDSSVPSIQLQLESFITRYLQKNMNLISLFDEQGFDITPGEMNVSVVIGENDVTAFLTYPLEITKESTDEVTNISYFYTNHQIRLRTVYNLAHDIIKEDIVKILFDISDTSNNRDSMTIKKMESDSGHDDIIIIRDNKSMLYAKPYTFQFARENRYPALHYIKDVSPFLLPPFHAITTEEMHSKISPKAYDPDEDDLGFSYSHCPYQLEQSDYDNEYISLTVYVKEKNNEGYNDWQDITIAISPAP